MLIGEKSPSVPSAVIPIFADRRYLACQIHQFSPSVPIPPILFTHRQISQPINSFKITAYHMTINRVYYIKSQEKNFCIILFKKTRATEALVVYCAALCKVSTVMPQIVQTF